MLHKAIFLQNVLSFNEDAPSPSANLANILYMEILRVAKDVRHYGTLLCVVLFPNKSTLDKLPMKFLQGSKR